MKYKYPILAIMLIAVGGITFGNVMAATFNEVVLVNDNFAVLDGGVTVHRTTGQPSAITVQNSGSSSLIKLFDLDSSEEMHIRLNPDGKRLDFVNIGVGAPISVSMVTNNVGIGGQLVPTEALDVLGNAKVSGDLKVGGDIVPASGNDICIGACP